MTSMRRRVGVARFPDAPAVRFGAVLFVLAALPTALRRALLVRRARLGRALLRLSARGASRRASGTPTTSRSRRRPVGTRGATTPSATARSSRSSTASSGEGPRVAPVVDALDGRRARRGDVGARAARALRDAGARRRAPRRAAPGAHSLRGARDDRAAGRARHAREPSGSPCATRARCAASCSARSCLGVAALVRPQALLCAPFLGLVMPGVSSRSVARARRRHGARLRARARTRPARGRRATAA